MTWALLLGGLGKLLRGALGLIRDYPWQATVIALLCACAWLWTGWNGTEDDLRHCRIARESDRAAYEQAQKDAEAKALAAKEAAEGHYRQIAERADHDHQTELADANARAERYIAANRVRRHGAASPSGGPSATPQDNGAGGGNGPGEPPELVAVTEDDVRICTENTTRLEAVRDWALELTR